MTTPEACFGELMRATPSQPFVTYYDEASGERVELSVRSLGNWVAKTHFLLQDDLGLGVGAAAYLDLPAHWLSVPAVLGCLSAGLALVDDPAIADVAFVGRDAAPDAPDVFAVGVALDGVADYTAAVRPMPDAWTSVRMPALPSDPCLAGRSRGEVVAWAGGLPSGSRILTTRDWTSAQDLVDTLLAPLVAAGSIVFVRNCRDEAVLDRRMQQERATVRI